MFSLSYKRLRSIFTFCLSLMLCVAVAICHCPPQTAKADHPCHETANHEHDGGDSHENSKGGHACLCDGGSITGYLVQAEKAPLKTDFLVAVLNPFQIGFEIAQSLFQSLRSTHSPPLPSQPLYITHLTLLI